MKLSEFQIEVSRRVDTAGTKINVAETKRVLAVAFVLGELDGAELVDVVKVAVTPKTAASKK